MLAAMTTYVALAQTHPGLPDGNRPWDSGGPGWWLIFPIVFWVLVLSVAGYLIYRRSPTQNARGAAERVLAERYARGEIGDDELKQRRAVLRGKS